MDFLCLFNLEKKKLLQKKCIAFYELIFACQYQEQRVLSFSIERFSLLKWLFILILYDIVKKVWVLEYIY